MLMRVLPQTAARPPVLILGANDDLGPEKGPLSCGCDRGRANRLTLRGVHQNPSELKLHPWKQTDVLATGVTAKQRANGTPEERLV